MNRIGIGIAAALFLTVLTYQATLANPPTGLLYYSEHETTPDDLLIRKILL